MTTDKGFAIRLAGVSSVGFLTYAGEYISYIVILAWISDKLLIQFNLGPLTDFFVGVVSSAYLIISGLLAIPFGRLCDKYGRRIFSILGSMLGGGALLSLSLANMLNSLTQFSFAISSILIALGLGHATYTASTWAYVGDIAREGNLGKSYSLLELAEYAAYSFGPAIGGVIAYVLGRELTFILSAFILFIAALIAYITMSESKINRVKDNVEEVHGLDRINWRVVLDAISNKKVILTLITTFVMSLALQAFYIYIPLLAYSLSAVIPIFRIIAPALASLAAGTSILMMLPFGFIVDSTRRRMPFIVAGLVVGSASLIIVSLLLTLPSLISSALVFGTALAMARVGQAVVLAENTIKENRASVMGTNHAVEHAGYGVGALIGGSLIFLYGVSSTFRSLAAVLLIVAITFTLYVARQRLK